MRKIQTDLSKILNLRLSKLMIINTCLLLSCNPGKINQSQTKSILEVNQSDYLNNIQTDPITDQSIENADQSLQLSDEKQQSIDDPQIIAQAAYGRAFYLGKFGCHKSYVWGAFRKKVVKPNNLFGIFGVNCVNSNNQKAYGAPGEVPGAVAYNGGELVDVVGSDCYRSENNQFDYKNKYYAIRPDWALSNQICFILETDLEKS